MAFTNDQLERYSRHIILKEVGAKGQKKLLNSSVLIIGAGGLGAPAALYLAAAGVGTIGIAEFSVNYCFYCFFCARPKVYQLIYYYHMPS